MKEFEHEPIRGLPEQLPEGERILWQGRPSWRGLALGAFRMREVAAYFAALGVGKALYAAIGGASAGIVALEFIGMAAPAVLALAVLAGLARLCERSTVYTITNKRVVMRFGMALEKAVNLPFTAIAQAAAKIDANGRGDIALTLEDKSRVSYVAFWPHVRPLRFSRAQPSLRGLNGANAVAAILATALADAHGQSVAPQPAPERAAVPRPVSQVSQPQPA